MVPIEQIIPGFKLPDNEMIIIAKNQPPYLPLPAWKGPDGVRVTRWKLSWKERLYVLFGGSIWVTISTFGKKLQPLKLETACPIMGSAMEDEEI